MIGEDVVFTQRFLKLEGFYQARIDGVWGRLSERAYRDFEGSSETLMRKIGRFDYRSETHIRSLCLIAQESARQLIFVLAKHEFTAKIISGTRSYHEQNALFKIGRYGDDRPRVTKARGGFSRHNFGIAFDIGLFSFEEGYITREQPYIDAGDIVMQKLSDTLEWGGRWPGDFQDWPHYQLKTGMGINQLRAQFEGVDDLRRAA